MRVFVFPLISLFLLGMLIDVAAFAQSKTQGFTIEQPGPGILIVQKRSKKRYGFTTNTKVKYWVVGEQFATKGFIEGFSPDAIWISGQKILLRDLRAIKKADKPIHNIFKVVGPVLGIGGATVGIFGGLILKELEAKEESVNLPYIIAGVSIFAGALPIISKSKKHVRSKNKVFSIVMTNSESGKRRDLE